MIISLTHKSTTIYTYINKDGSKTYVTVEEVFDRGNYEYTEVRIDGKTTAIQGSTIEALELGLPAEMANEIRRIRERS